MLTAIIQAMEIDKLAYAPAMLARLVNSHGAHKLSERLVSEAATPSDGYGRGASPLEVRMAGCMSACNRSSSFALGHAAQ
jgi:predicted metal-binding protein